MKAWRLYPKDAPTRLLAMIASGLLDLGSVNLRTFALSELPATMDAAANMRALDATVLTCV